MRLLLVVLLLLVPHLAAADPLFTFAYHEASNAFLYLDEEHHDNPQGSHASTVQAIQLQGGELTTPAGAFLVRYNLGAWDVFTATSGAFISKVETWGIDGGEPYLIDAHSRFAAGGTLYAPWVVELPNGTERTLTFTADLGPWDIHYDDSFGHFTVPFSNGRFDSVAGFLGLPSQGISGVWQIWVNPYHREDEGNDYRAFTMFGQIDALEVASVPEPGIALLLIAGLVLRKWRAA